MHDEGEQEHLHDQCVFHEKAPEPKTAVIYNGATEKTRLTRTFIDQDW
jgi:hypothetical protein